MRPYNEIMADIENLKKEAEASRKHELAQVMLEIMVRMQQYEITMEDLQGAMARYQQRLNRPATPVKKSLDAQYVHPVTGETWAGRGVIPAWLRKEVEAGRDREEFRVKPAAQQSAAQPAASAAIPPAQPAAQPA